MEVHVLDNYYLAITLLITIGYQLFFFFIAFSLKFDKLTGISPAINCRRSLTIYRFRWWNQFCCSCHHYACIQWTSQCPPNRGLSLHHGLGPATLCFPPLPNLEDRKRRQIRRQARQVLPIPWLLGIPDDLGLDCLVTCHRIELAKCHPVLTASFWNGQRYCGCCSVRNRLDDGECQ
jgi:hypothetical protein